MYSRRNQSEGQSSARNSRMSAGWQSRAVQIALRVLKRMALALPVLRIERFAIVMPTRSESSVMLIFRFKLTAAAYAVGELCSIDFSAFGTSH